MPLLIGAPSSPRHRSDRPHWPLRGPLNLPTTPPSTSPPGQDGQPVRDWQWTHRATPNASFCYDGTALDVLIVPGGRGTLPLMGRPRHSPTSSAAKRRKSRHGFHVALRPALRRCHLLGAAGPPHRPPRHHPLELPPPPPPLRRHSRRSWPRRRRLGLVILRAGITAGIDNSPSRAHAHSLSDNATAQYIQLILHYAPPPPFKHRHLLTPPPKEILAPRLNKNTP